MERGGGGDVIYKYARFTTQHPTTRARLATRETSPTLVRRAIRVVLRSLLPLMIFRDASAICAVHYGMLNYD